MAEKSLGGQVVAELVGTFMLILLGDGVVANVGLAPRLAATAYNWNTIAFGWGFAVMVAVYAVGGISGAHINPAVTIGMAVRGVFPWKNVGPFVVAQIFGAFLGAAGVYACYYDGLKSAGMPNVWCTGPGSTMAQAYWGGGTKVAVGSYSLGIAFITEIIATAVLLLAICAITDATNVGPGANIWPLVVGFLIVSIGLSLGGPSGYALNPARDLGPRMFGALAGTTGLFSFSGATSWYWLVPPIIGTIIGGIIGVLVYKYVVAPFLPKPK
jgi:glycerol uptake facilitator protein